MLDTPSHPTPTAPRPGPGITLIAASILVVGVMAVHPTAHAHTFQELVAELASVAGFNGAVHGVAIGGAAGLLLASWGFADALGLRLLLVRAGLVAYGFGSIALAAAASINGFVICRLAQQVDPADSDGVERLRPLLALCRVGNETCDHVGIFAWSAALACWSVVLVGRAGPARPLGALGLLVAVAPPAAVLAGKLPMSVHGFGVFVLLQAVWSVWAGVLLIRGKL